MEFVLRCNDLKCRTQLHDRAVVTTCSHVFCPPCCDTSGLSRSPNANRSCPACGTELANPDDVVVAGLNPTEDYKTSVLSGLNPTIIMECASRGLAFYSYQASQEIVYQEHSVKKITERYASLSQQIDQLIHDANAQIKALQEKMQAMQAEQAALEQKNHDLVDAFREKSRSQQHVQKLYQSLKAQVMASHVANAAGEEVDNSIHTVRGDRFVDRIPGARTGTGNYSQPVGSQQMGQGRRHNRDGSGSSGNGGQRRGDIGLGPSWNAPSQSYGLQSRGYTGQSAPAGPPPSQGHQSRLPVLGSTRPNAFSGVEPGPAYQPSPATRQPLGVGSRAMGGFGYGAKAGNRGVGGGENGPFAR